MSSAKTNLVLAGVAQLVERLPSKQDVAGPSPVARSQQAAIPDWVAVLLFVTARTQRPRRDCHLAEPAICDKLFTGSYLPLAITYLR